MPQDIVSIDKKTRKKSAPKWTFLTPIFWPFHRCETGKRGYGVKFQVSQESEEEGTGSFVFTEKKEEGHPYGEMEKTE